MLAFTVAIVCGMFATTVAADPAPTRIAQVKDIPAGVPAECLIAVPHSPAAHHIDKTLGEKMIPIGVMILVIAFVMMRLPKVDVGHSSAFRRRRLLNWLPLGLTYAFLYMARYNLKQFQHIGGISEVEYGTIFGIGSAVYGLSFLLNGPLTDRWGGRITILISAIGSALANVAMGIVVLTQAGGAHKVALFATLYGANMYFQSFGAVSIVKVNAAWFHLRERGTFGGIFGILISLGLFFAYDGSPLITDNLAVPWLFVLPALILCAFFVMCWLWVRDRPSEAGFVDFHPGDATTGVSPAVRVAKPSSRKVMWRIISNPIILTIACIELCSGFLRQAILQWGPDFGKGLDLSSSFVFSNWGVVSCIAGITGGMFAGAISDQLFQSRRGPVTAVLYGLMLIGAIAIIPLLGAPSAIPWIIAFMSMAIIGVHGMLSGAASQDFGGIANAGIAVGIIDGFVYLGSTVQSFLYGSMLPAAKLYCPDGTTRSNPASHVLSNWHVWPYTMVPVAIVGLLLSIKLWNARATKRAE